MTILLVVNDLTRTHGWSQYAANIVDEAIADGQRVVVASATSDPSEYPGVLQQKVLPIDLKFHWNPWRIYQGRQALCRVAKEVEPDVVHFIAEPYALTLAFGPIYAGARHLLTVHGTLAVLPQSVHSAWRRLCSWALFKRSLRQLDGVIAVSETTRQTFVSALRWTPPIAVIKNSMPVVSTVSNRQPGPPYRVITVGYVKERKGVLEIMRTLAAWSQATQTPVQYDVVGVVEDGLPYVEAVKQLATTAPHEHFSLTLHGGLPEAEKVALLQQAHLYAHLEQCRPGDTNREGFGIGIIEAAAYGVPAIVHVGSATTEAVKDGVSGYVVDLEKPEALHAKIKAILLDDALRSTEIIAWATSHSPAACYQEIKKVYAGNT